MDRPSALSGQSFPGDRIQALAFHPTGHDIWLVNRDGTGLRRLADLGEAKPSLAFSADGRGLWVVALQGLYWVDIGSGATTKVSTEMASGQIVLLRH
jgi:hypothetical protein